MAGLWEPSELVDGEKQKIVVSQVRISSTVPASIISLTTVRLPNDSLQVQVTPLELDRTTFSFSL